MTSAVCCGLDVAAGFFFRLPKMFMVTAVRVCDGCQAVCERGFCHPCARGRGKVTLGEGEVAAETVCLQWAHARRDGVRQLRVEPGNREQLCLANAAGAGEGGNVLGNLVL